MGDGRWTVFDTPDDVLTGDTNAVNDVYLHSIGHESAPK
jgi:hypothetical protein